MQSTALSILFSPEVLPWERKAIESISGFLSRSYSFSVSEITPSRRSSFSNQKGISWIVSNRWREALEFVGADKTSNPIFVSVIHPHHYHRSWYKLLASKFINEIPRNIEFIVHSEFSKRYLVEFEGISKEKVHLLPFGVPVIEESQKVENTEFTVGAFATFESASNLSHLMSIAHYLKHKKMPIQFRVYGTGELYRHLAVQVWEMDLEDVVAVIETNEVEVLNEVDALVHLPVTQDHFLPLLYAAKMGKPVIASDSLGISSYIADTHSGFILPVNETKSFAELLIRLANDRVMTSSLGEKFKASLAEKFSWGEILPQYEKLFFGANEGTSKLKRAA